MPDVERVQCPRCDDVHAVEARVEDDGSRRCPVCGEATAIAVDTCDRP